MAKLLRDTAKRSLLDLFEALPPQAVVEISHSGRPPRGTALAVKIVIAEKSETSKAKAADAPAKAPEAGSDDEAVQGQRGPQLGRSGKRGGGKAG